MLEDIPERSGIYLFYMPKLEKGYVGRTRNLKLRYNQHILEGSHKKVLKNYQDSYGDIEFLVLEFTDSYTAKDQSKIEKQWITHYRNKGINLLNITDPTKELNLYKDGKSVIAYDLELNFVGEWQTFTLAAKAVNGVHQNISKAVYEIKRANTNTNLIVYKNLLWFLKDDFSEDALLKKRDRYFAAKNHCRNVCSLNGKKVSKRIKQIDIHGRCVRLWDSAKEAGNTLGCDPSAITKCARKFRYKTVGGYNWQYVSTSN